MLNSKRVENWQQQQGNKSSCISRLRLVFLTLCLPVAKHNTGLGRCVCGGWVDREAMWSQDPRLGEAGGGRKMVYVVTPEVLLS